jgi:type I restriction enzyme, S subunit
MGGTVPWIKIGDGSKGDGLYLENTHDYVTELGAKKSVFLEPGSLIFANCGVSLGFARILKIGGCIHDGWLAFEQIDKRLNQIFLLRTLNQLTSYFRSLAPDGTQPNLNTGIMSDFQMILPPLFLQEKFAQYCPTL